MNVALVVKRKEATTALCAVACVCMCVVVGCVTHSSGLCARAHTHTGLDCTRNATYVCIYTCLHCTAHTYVTASHQNNHSVSLTSKQQKAAVVHFGGPTPSHLSSHFG